MADKFDSDPDIFISKTNRFPTNQDESDYYCMKVGSDTCVVPPSNIAFLDMFYIGIRCIEECVYDLKVMYMTTANLLDNEAYLEIVEGHQSNLFVYSVPSSANDGFTSAFKVTIVGDNTYQPIDIALSLDEDIYQIEEKLNKLVLGKGMGIKFTSDSISFCTNCNVYLLIEFQAQGAYYITASATARN
mmetsp:Transcript_22972/g.22315  ORF Transcript_22972/g.22315 Transcript_22972/m.22315 type:complete len:188 (+) Transcript_22972:289-852(+)